MNSRWTKRIVAVELYSFEEEERFSLVGLMVCSRLQYYRRLENSSMASEVDRNIFGIQLPGLLQITKQGSQ